MPLLNRQVGDVNCSARSLSKSDLHTLERLKEENQELRKRYMLSFIGHELLMFNIVTMASLCSNLAPPPICFSCGVDLRKGREKF